MGKKTEIQPGKKFNKLTIKLELPSYRQPSGQTQRKFLCICDCGKEKEVRLSHLRLNRVKSCGCMSKEQHGYSGTKLHNSWRGMRNRCYGKKYAEPQYYQQKGVKFVMNGIRASMPSRIGL